MRWMPGAGTLGEVAPVRRYVIPSDARRERQRWWSAAPVVAMLTREKNRLKQAEPLWHRN
jgi:hypothetical protein